MTQPAHDDKPQKYVVHPLYVKSQSDGQTHFITAEQLISLYGVNPKDCTVYKDNWSRGISLDEVKKYKHLYPKENGDYTL